MKLSHLPLLVIVHRVLSSSIIACPTTWNTTIQAETKRGMWYMNQYRACWNSGPLRYEKESEETAQKWADTILGHAGALEHGMLTDSRGRPVGQNILMSGPKYSIEKAVRKWYREYVFYHGHYDPSSGHFSQLVWNSTVGVGIGIARDASHAVFVANFRPPGNVEGLFSSNIFHLHCVS